MRIGRGTLQGFATIFGDNKILTCLWDLSVAHGRCQLFDFPLRGLRIQLVSEIPASFVRKRNCWIVFPNHDDHLHHYHDHQHEPSIQLFIYFFFGAPHQPFPFQKVDFRPLGLLCAPAAHGCHLRPLDFFEGRHAA